MVGLRIAAPSFVYSAFAVQLLGGLLFLGQMALDSLFGGNSFKGGWFGLLAAFCAAQRGCSLCHATGEDKEAGVADHAWFGAGAG